MAPKSKSFNASASDNPLINPKDMPYGAPDFSAIKTEHIEPAIDWALDKLLEEIDVIRDNDELPTFENTVEALELAGADYGRIMSVFHVLSMNNANDEIRALEVKIDKKTTPIFSELSMDDALFERIKSVYDAKDGLDLDQEQTMLLENSYQGRVRSGALLEGEDKESLKKISTQLAELSTKFGQNTMKATAEYERIASIEELEGVPERSIKAYQASAKNAVAKAEKAAIKAQGGLEAVQAMDVKDFKSEKIAGKKLKKAQKHAERTMQAYIERKDALPEGACLVKLQPPPLEILSHCKNRELRKEINDALDSRATSGEFDNSEVVLDIIRLRHAKAQLLGFDNYAEFTLADRMAGNAQTVMDFLQNNLEAYKPAAEKHFENVKAYAMAIGEIDEMQPHDFGYYARKLKEERFNFDSEKLRPYFEVNNVLDGFRDHVEKLFNVEMINCTGDYPVYRDDAQIFEVKDKNSGEVKALFYADYFADAEAKSGGAWAMGVRKRAIDKQGNDQIPIVTNSCNYQAPSEDQPSLLSFRDVETLFHEGGHAFHGILSEGKYASLNGTSVKRDFVELPSQLMENWLGEPEVLRSFAKNYETGEPIPEEYIEKIKEMGNYGSANMGLGQTSYALIDMLWHTTDPSTINSIDDIEDKVHEMTSFYPERSKTMSTSFGHLFSGGYASGYYGYKWAEVLDADIFEEFKRNGLYDQNTAQRVVEHIYSTGGQVDPAELFRRMMGRDPDPSALYRREGLSANDNNPAQTPDLAQDNAPAAG